MKKYYVAVDIGCLECGEESACLGVFKRKSDADRVAREAEDIQNKNWHGQHEFLVFEVENIT